MNSPASNKSNPKPRLIRGVYFIWIIVPFILLDIYHAYGLPHMIWRYSFLDNGDHYNPFADRHYTSCTFIGPYGEFTRNAHQGKCGWFAFFKEGADQ